MNREELRDAAINALQTSHNIAIQAATGVGKSKIAIDICKECAKRERRDLKKILLVIAERAHYKNWKDELIKWSYDVPIEIICYASLRKKRDSNWDIIIFDEAHHLNSELRLDTFETMGARYRVFLSATLKDSLIIKLECSCGPIKSFKMGLQEAFSNNVLPEPKIVLIPLTLDKTKQDHIIVEEWGKKDKRLTYKCTYAERWRFLRNKRSYPNVKLLISCTQQQQYDYLCEQFEYYKKRYMLTRNEILKNKWLQCGSRRKVFIGTEKTEIAKHILEKVKNKRFVCFCTNIEQAETLGGVNAVHSKKKDNQAIVNKFNEGQTNSLFAVGMLQEGMNLNNIEAGVIIQLDGEERSFIQRFGRTLRADSPVQYIIYYKGTRDEEYLKNALDKIDTKYIQEAKYEYFSK